MANIRENLRGGKVVSYRFIAFLGRDSSGRQIRKYTTWVPPKGVGPRTARKEAEKQAILWEECLKNDDTYEKVPEGHKKKDYLYKFIDNVWFPLQVNGNDRKAKTVNPLYSL